MENFREFLNEASLSRIWQKTKDYDTGAITAFRDEKTRKENLADNKKVLAYLLDKGYSVIKVKGSYIENFGSKDAKEKGEESFFVADTEKSGKLKDDLIKLGRKYDQDSILWVEKDKPGVLIGTSKRSNSYPGYDKVVVVGKPKFGEAKGQFFSRVRGRQFAFEEMTVPPTRNGKWAMSLMAQEVEKSLESY